MAGEQLKRSPAVTEDERTYKNTRSSESAPEARYRLHPDTSIETTEQLRTAIDQGHAGDKVDVSDPAAAPLGTDAMKREEALIP